MKYYLSRLLQILLLAGCIALLLYTLSVPTTYLSRIASVFGGGDASEALPPLGTLLDPHEGLYRTARQADAAAGDTLRLTGLEQPVRVVRDKRGVPHIFAPTDREAVIALGYVVAQDRLFQLDFLPRVAAGRMAEIMGPDLIETDRFMRSTGMLWGARANLERIMSENGQEADLLRWFSEGVNGYLETLDDAELPIECKLLGYRPAPYEPLHSLLMLQYMNYTLSYGTDATDYSQLQKLMNETEYNKLFPVHSRLSVPIIPEESPATYHLRPFTRDTLDASSDALPKNPSKADTSRTDTLKAASPEVDAPEADSSEADSSEADSSEADSSEADSAGAASSAANRSKAEALLAAHEQQLAALAETVAEGFREGNGSNNWAVDASRSTTGAPILAGDMHLSLRLPAIWYEVHLVTPTMNTYGVTVPGAPLPVEAFNDRLGWAFTNAGTDQIDHYMLALDVSGRRYRFEGGWRDLEVLIDTIHVHREEPAFDTVFVSHWGPLIRRDRTTAVAIQWAAHKPSRTLAALWGMNRAKTYAAFEEALRQWDTPMQNILYAGTDGTIAIWSAGYLPVRAGGHGIALLDGSTSDFAWTGRVPFEALPHAVNPRQGYLTSTNQEPTGSDYPYYLRHDWNDAYRSIRIDSLLRARPRHSVRDLMTYQADVHAVQRDLFVPLLDTLENLNPRADTLRLMLGAWDGDTGTDRTEPLVLHVFLETLQDLAWDEFEGRRSPRETQLYYLLTQEPASQWMDIRSTNLRKETATDLLKLALEATADTLEARFGWGPANWRWGDHHKLLVRHLLEPLRPLQRGPYEFPGFEKTLSPARGMVATHSASWRMVVDFSQTPPVGYGVYPGGQSGNPMSPHYDDGLTAYLNFSYHRLHKPDAPERLALEHVAEAFTLIPGSSTP